MSWQRGRGEAEIGSDARPVRRSEMVTMSRGELADLVAKAEVRAGRMRALAMVIGAAIGLAVAFWVNRAFGETIQIGRHFINGEPTIPSSVTILPSVVPGQLAVVTFDNRHVNQEEDNGIREIGTADVAVAVRFTFDFNSVTGADRIDVTPPSGVTCDPEDCGVTVMEGLSGRVVLFDWRGM
jgi:HAMP domain-containing protein